MSSKTYYFDFYNCTTINSNPNAIQQTPFDIFESLTTKTQAANSTLKTVNGVEYEIRYIERTDFGFKGIIGKFRHSDLPHAAQIGGAEREIELEPNESLLEKAHFHYYADYSLLILQRNHFCISFSAFSKYLNDAAYVTTLNPIISTTDLQLFLNDRVQIRTAELSIARPRNPELFQNVEHDFNNSLFATLNGANAPSLNLTIRGNARSDVENERYLASTLKGALRELTTVFDVKKCKLLVENQDSLITHPIDLIADRMVYYTDIHVEGRYPQAADMWNALREARADKEAQLIEYFGDQNGHQLA
jgi:hypothetical protein